MLSLRASNVLFMSALALLLYGVVPAFAGELLVLRGRDTFTFRIISPNRPGCPAGSFSTSDSGRGTASHVGAYTFTAGECISHDLQISQGFFTITTDNGEDSISGNYSGTGKFTDATGTSFIYGVAGLINGGTGRFKDVTGSLAFLGGGSF